MKFTHKTPLIGKFNLMSLAALSFTWAHFLGLISPWFIPLTVLLYLIGFGSEINPSEIKDRK